MGYIILRGFYIIYKFSLSICIHEVNIKHTWEYNAAQYNGINNMASMLNISELTAIGQK